MIVIGSRIYGLDGNCGVWERREKGESCCRGDEVELKRGLVLVRRAERVNFAE